MAVRSSNDKACDSCGYVAPPVLSGEMIINKITYAKMPINWWFEINSRKVFCSVCMISISDEESEDVK